jgi:hypothetical protein
MILYGLTLHRKLFLIWPCAAATKMLLSYSWDGLVLPRKLLLKKPLGWVTAEQETAVVYFLG